MNPDGHPDYLRLAERMYHHDQDGLGMLLDDFDHTQQVMKGMLVSAIHCPGAASKGCCQLIQPRELR